MSLSEKEVLQVGRLAALAMDEGEVKRYQTELGSILEYVHRLQQADTRGVPPTSHVHGVVNFFRDDIIKDSLPVESVREIAPDFSGGGFRVPRIIG